MFEINFEMRVQRERVSVDEQVKFQFQGSCVNYKVVQFRDGWLVLWKKSFILEAVIVGFLVVFFQISN